jgi:hypothetical protein
MELTIRQKRLIEVLPRSVLLRPSAHSEMRSWLRSFQTRSLRMVKYSPAPTPPSRIVRPTRFQNPKDEGTVK